MAQSEAPPSSSSSGKYLVLALLLLAGGVGTYVATRSEPPPPPPPVAEPPRAERSTALAEPEIPVVEDTPPDAGLAAAEPTDEIKKPHGGGSGSGSWSCQGDIPTQQIRQVIADNQAQVRSCYEKRLRNNNNLQGSLVLQVKVGAGGKVIATRAKGSLGEEAVSNCVQALAKTWTFPIPAGGSCAVFEAPYNFTPKN